jgi:large subunit ribosomal protein L24
MSSTKLRKGDRVRVMAGGSVGAEGEIERFDRKHDRVYVKGVNLRKRHKRADAQNPDGGIVEKHMPVHISNVMLLDPSNGKPTRIGYKLDSDGSKTRIAKSSGTVL